MFSFMFAVLGSLMFWAIFGVFYITGWLFTLKALKQDYLNRIATGKATSSDIAVMTVQFFLWWVSLAIRLFMFLWGLLFKRMLTAILKTIAGFAVNKIPKVQITFGDDNKPQKEVPVPGAEG